MSTQNQIQSKSTHNINTVVLKDFIDMVVNENLAAIAFDQAIFFEIYYKYIEISGGQKAIANLRKLLKVNTLKAKIEVAIMHLELLDSLTTIDVFNSCYAIGYRLPKFEYSEDNARNLYKYLDAQVKADLIKLEHEQNLVAAKETSEGVTEAYFYELIFDIEAKLNVRIDESTCTVHKFALAVDRLNKYYIKIQSKQ